ncbi:MAG TPA: RNA ligase family protein [Bryobacteraceae bacterium]|nr:RNA ligase family protein [Bryobacteraceae bacterium]
MKGIVKYPRTPHLNGSRIQPGDEDLATVNAGGLAGLSLVIEEKLDGSNSGISFDPDGTLVLQSRGHVLTGGPCERQFDLFKRWASVHRHALWNVLGSRYLMYGEWLYARHTIFYDQLPHYFLEFDLLDRDTGAFLSTEQRQSMLAGSPVHSVPILATSPVADWEQLLGRSRCSSNEQMEGLYIKWEADGRVQGRYKYVRRGFLQAVEDSEGHWMDRPIEPNRLLPGTDLFAP